MAPDSFSRAFLSAIPASDLEDIHKALCHPGVTQMVHFIQSKNLPFSTDDVKITCSGCRVCAELKPQFYRPIPGSLIKATQPMERLSMDFKGPLPSPSRNTYILTIVDEYSHFPFAYPYPNKNSTTVMKCHDQLFTPCGYLSYIHSDHGAWGVATSKTTPYHPTCNGQVER